MLAQNFSEDPQSAANGGDLGFIPQSLSDQVPDRHVLNVILETQPGQITRPIRSQERTGSLKSYRRNLQVNAN